MAYTVKSLRQIDGNYTCLLLFVKGASPIIPQLDQRRSARVSLEEARHVRLTSSCERGIQLIKHYFFKKFGDCRKVTDWSVIFLVGYFILFVDKGDIAHFPITWKSTCANTIIKQSRQRCSQGWNR